MSRCQPTSAASSGPDRALPIGAASARWRFDASFLSEQSSALVTAGTGQNETVVLKSVMGLLAAGDSAWI